MPDFELEREIGGLVAGIDEVGRGPLAGPVVAAAVLFDVPPPADLQDIVDDSKKLSAARREAVLDRLFAHARIGVGAASVAEIDRLNILQATMLAMQRALGALSVTPDAALIDGNRAPALSCPVRTVVGGDGRSLSIAAASIVAKVTRDTAMARLAERYPGFGWERNAGYGTAEHTAALDRLGPTPHHRRSFRPVAKHFL